MKRISLLDSSAALSSRSRLLKTSVSPLAPAVSWESAMQIPFAPEADWPLGPAVEHAIASALREAIGIGLSLTEMTERLNEVLRGFDIELSYDQKRTIIGAHVMGAG